MAASACHTVGLGDCRRTGGDDWRNVSDVLWTVGIPYYALFLVYIAFFFFVITNHFFIQNKSFSKAVKTCNRVTLFNLNSLDPKNVIKSLVDDGEPRRS